MTSTILTPPQSELDDHEGIAILPMELGRRLDRDVRAAAAELPLSAVRYFVDDYYSIQDLRIQAGNQLRAMSEAGEPASLVSYLQTNFHTIEKQAQAVLDVWSANQPLGRWVREVKGIGPVIASGLMAHVDIEKSHSVSALWRFAGLDPTSVWGKGQKRPWNAKLKVICFKAGESFVKVQNRGSVYGGLYRARKDAETERNEAGGFAEVAARYLTEKNYGRDTVARTWLEQGKLPPAALHGRARRYAVKIFLEHYWEAGYRLHHHTLPPKPYVIEHMGHVDLIEPEVPYPEI